MIMTNSFSQKYNLIKKKIINKELGISANNGPT
jgi:hypothetical protein